ncbi:hypothetical protein PRIPAC_75440 [Pristionchus pacificus]|uniref:Transmembrane ion channel n=1 Tax=Pristionchus pacificus TaxID=54126 RepID=A0A2A6C0N8_PRIPA|nr:hypothetical protein PRIPAC_75440 [Pristionchus pacificus]|eukprot:PDM71710.1 transmembrane ion channel [Pristionchus pacificus]
MRDYRVTEEVVMIGVSTTFAIVWSLRFDRVSRKCKYKTLFADFKSYWGTMKELQLKLFTDYDNSLSPFSTKDANYTWNAEGGQASVRLVRSKLLSVHEPEQQFTAATGVLMEWTDPRLTWDEQLYNGISHLYMKRSRVWMPDIVPCESTGLETVALFDTNNAKIYSDGRVETLVYFFATHNCEIKVGELQLTGGLGVTPELFGTGEFDFTLFMPRPSFTMASTDDKLPFSSVMFHFVISRQPQFWVSLIIIPTFFIGMLVLIGIFFGEEGNSLNEVVSRASKTNEYSTSFENEYSFSEPFEYSFSEPFEYSFSRRVLASISLEMGESRFVFFDIIIVVVAIVVILFADKMRRKLKRLSEEKLKCPKTSAVWRLVKRYVTSNKIGRYLLFTVFSVLHVVNLIMMLIRPADTGAYETLTTFNVTIS